jgi:hypothetical protein
MAPRPEPKGSFSAKFTVIDSFLRVKGEKIEGISPFFI